MSAVLLGDVPSGSLFVSFSPADGGFAQLLIWDFFGGAVLWPGSLSRA